MIKIIYVIMASIALYGASDDLSDMDLDGVPDSIDRCPNSPFLATVNQNGCVTKRLYLPEDETKAGAIFSLGYGYITNEDLIGKKREDITKVKLKYYDKNWSATIKSGYYSYSGSSGLEDTILKIQRYFMYMDDFRTSLGVGIKLPSYDFEGNNVDYILYSSAKYYLKRDMSLFGGLKYTFINDDEISLDLVDSYSIHIGIGEFFTKDIYANLSFSHQVSKFKEEESINNLSSTIYYKINRNYFTTLTYQRDLLDEDLHDSMLFNINYKIW